MDFDLLIAGGTANDPSQSLNAVRDVGIKDGLVSAVAPSISPALATEVYSAVGKIVIPGLVDTMVHPWTQRNAALNINADAAMAESGATTLVSPGDAGPGMFGAFKRQVIDIAAARVFGFVSVHYRGWWDWPNTQISADDIEAQDVASELIAYKDHAVGVKVLLGQWSGTLGIIPVQKAVEAATIAEAVTGNTYRVMVHIGALASQQILSDTISTLRSGDCITHCYVGGQNNFGQYPVLAQTAQAKGILLNVGYSGSFDSGTASQLINAGIKPNIISSDRHADEAVTMLGVMSVMRQKGLTLIEVIAASTWEPAKWINRVSKLGTLQVGAPGDVTIIQEAGTQLSLVQTVKAGELIAGPPLPAEYDTVTGPSAGVVLWPGAYDLGARVSLTPGRTVISLGALLSQPKAATLKIIRQDVAGVPGIPGANGTPGNYVTVASVPLNHSGSGAFEDATLAVPYLIPNDGKAYFRAIYFPAPASSHASIRTGICWASGNNPGSMSMVEWNDNPMIALRARYQ